MLLWLFYWLLSSFTPLRVVRYTSFRVIAAMVTATDQPLPVPTFHKVLTAEADRPGDQT